MWKHCNITSNYVSMKTAHAIGAMVCLDDMVFENYSITKLWFYKSKRYKFWFRKKEVTSGVSKTPKDYNFDKTIVLVF